MNSYEYIDGSGNVYAISSTAIVYDPVTQEESSSGIYSGGEPYNVTIESKQFDYLEKIFKTVIGITNGQTKERSKGTGMLIILPKYTTYIFEMNSIQKKEIEGAIKLLVQR